VKTLSVVRHAHAENAPPGKHDRDRVLSQRGQREAAIAAAKFATDYPDADLVLASPARRARATAEAFAQALGFDGRAVESDERLYLAGAELLFEIVRALDESFRHVVLIGHNPGVSAFVRELTDDVQAEELATGAVRTFQCDVGAWQELHTGSAPLVDG
jgi:phosphohistidine phosphatase